MGDSWGSPSELQSEEVPTSAVFARQERVQVGCPGYWFWRVTHGVSDDAIHMLIS